MRHADSPAPISPGISGLHRPIKQRCLMTRPGHLRPAPPPIPQPRYQSSTSKVTPRSNRPDQLPCAGGDRRIFAAVESGFIPTGACQRQGNIRDDIHEAFLSLAEGIACWRRLAGLSLCEEF